MSKNVEIYHLGAALFAAQYDALHFEQVHASWQQYWPKEHMVLDIGAGSGRDALWCAKQGCQVVAVEPAGDLRKLGQLKTAGFAVQWLDDSLSELKACYQLNLQFNTIFLAQFGCISHLMSANALFEK
ncbi:class I SAM-dependent methyltransferase [Alishewanella sp. HL-SH06]|uniref:class I SAM-dependent methyltransferase n=1 Tax=Alishewanella sp. HL-SH06 TaxID=3461144 RepID=UPI004041B06C